MSKNKFRIGGYLYVFTDIVAIVATWFVAYLLRFYSFLPTPLGIPALYQYTKLIPFILAIWLIASLLSDSYYSQSFHRSRRSFLLKVFRLCGVFTLALVSFIYFHDEYDYSRLTTLIFAALLPFAIFAMRLLGASFFRRLKLYDPPKNTILIASGKCLQEFIENPSYRSELQLSAVILAQGETLSEDQAYCQKAQLRVIEHHGDWAETFQRDPCESLVISLPYADYGFLEQHLDEISNQVTDVRIIPDILRYTRFHAAINMLDTTPIIHIHESPLSGLNSLLKRAMDLLGAGIAVVLFAPVMLIIAILIPFSSKGPILYRQQRMGLDGRTFNCLKFRSMPLDAEDKTGAVWATSGDNRATRLGAFLRKTSMDELPQLFNVLKGEMSLVGPRPERPVFVSSFRKQVPGYMLRHKVKTGITGWAQVNGWRGSTSIQKRIECDLYYIQNWSIWLDIKILIMTMEEVFLSKNAY